MGTSINQYQSELRTLAELMLAVSSESVSMVKRSVPEIELKLKRKDEWGIYLEFLKIMFNLVDRLSALHIPAKEQPFFMDGLGDTVTAQLKTVLEPAFGTGEDQMELVITIGAAIAESRQVYEAYRFLITEESKQKNEMFRAFGERVAELIGGPRKAHVASAATLCADAAVPAIQAILQGQTPPQAMISTTAQGQSGSPMTEGAHAQTPSTSNEIKLVSVMASTKGEEVETRWGLHPRFKQDLKPEEIQELTRLMNRVTKLLGERYAAVAFSKEWATWHQTGHA
jgi:hypothetical protein